MKVDIQRAQLTDARDIAVMTGEYRAEMAALAGVSEIDFQLKEETAILDEFLDNADYAVLIARSVRGHPLGYVTLFESQPYADAAYGIIEQLYVRPFYRQRRIARRMLNEAREFASKKRWRRLLVTFPVFFSLDAARSLFEKQGFRDPGQRKQWLLI
ncbi:MAG: GNAT family N-acetyltransferase [Oxalobacter sp.]|nr:GNAT family N-acetyltransferase [Oxalobacter sp.]